MDEWGGKKWESGEGRGRESESEKECKKVRD